MTKKAFFVLLIVDFTQFNAKIILILKIIPKIQVYENCRAKKNNWQKLVKSIFY